MSAFLGIAQQFLQADAWPFERDDELGLLRTGISGDGQSFRIVIQADDANQQLIAYTFASANVPEEKRVAAAEYLCRANYGLKMGNFELDMADGEVRYKTAIDVEGGSLCTTMVKNMVQVGAAMMLRYHPGLMKLIYGDRSPADCIREIEAA